MCDGQKKVVVAGHICLDITPIFSQDRMTNLNDILVPGKLVQMKAADVHTGGAVANTGLGMKILGADVKLMGKVGNDSFGTLVLEALKKYDASEDMIISDNDITSYSIVLAPPETDRIFLHSSGANDTFCFEDLDLKAIEEASLFHFGYPTLMKKLYENDGKELIQIFKAIKELGVATSLDMAAVDEHSESGRVGWSGVIENVLPYVDFFAPSIEELCYMLDKPKYYQLLKRADGKDITSVLSIEEDVKPLADKLIEIGAKVVLIKCGAPGMFYKTGDEKALGKIGKKLKADFTQWANREGFEKSYVPTEVLSGTGAGDTSIAAFLTAIVKGYPLETCLKLSAATGASCVSAYDALSGLQSFEELLDKIEKGWEKQ